MAIYEFLCDKCNHITQQHFSIKDDIRTVKCEKCNNDNSSHRIISRSNFHLKGPGWSNQYKPNTSAGSDDEKEPYVKPWTEPKY